MTKCPWDVNWMKHCYDKLIEDTIQAISFCP